jgi:hypothetical protein
VTSEITARGVMTAPSLQRSVRDKHLAKYLRDFKACTATS